MRRLIGLLFLLPSLALAQGLPTPWPGQCPSDAPGSALGCFPEAQTPLATDLVFSWQAGQTPETRALQVQQIFNAGLPASFTSLTVTGNATVGGTLGVTGATTLSSATLASLTVTGATTLNTLGVTGAATLASLGVTGATTLASLGVTGATTLNTLGVTGATTLASLGVTGATTLGFTGITKATALNANSTPLLATTWTFTNTGGVTSTIDAQTFNQANINSTSGQSIWANRDKIVFNGAATTAAPTFVTRVIENVLNTDRGGAANNAQSWALIASVVDLTMHSSATSGLLRTAELDMEVAGLDDYTPPLAGRQILSLVGIPARNYAGTDSHIKVALGIDQAGGTAGTFSFGRLIQLAGVVTDSALNIENITRSGSAVGIALGDINAIAFDTNRHMRLGWAIDSSPLLELQWLGANILSIDASGNVSARTLTLTTTTALVLTGQTSAVGGSTSTLTNSPKAGNPDFWVPMSINGVTGWFPWWHA